MGKSSDAKAVNTHLNDQYSQLNSDNNPLNSLMGGQQDWLQQQQGNQRGLFDNMLSNFGGLQSNNQGLMGNGVFGDLAKTGGFSDADKANYMSRATSNVPAFFSGIKDRMQNQNTINHGQNAGYTSQMSKLARDQGQASQNATMNATGSLHDMINQGKLAGASGLQQGAQAQNQFGLGKAGLANQMYGMGQQGSQSAFNNILQGLGMKQSQIDQILQMQDQRNPNKSAFSQFIGPILGAGGSLLGGIAGGAGKVAGAIGGGNSNNTSPYGPVDYQGGYY